MRTSTFSSGVRRYRAISCRENSDTVTTVLARRVAERVSHRLRQPSRRPNHSGCAKNDTSYTATTNGQDSLSGAVFAGAKKTSGLVRASARGRRVCSHRVPAPAPDSTTH